MSATRNLVPYWLSAPAGLAVLALLAFPLVLTFALSLYPLLPDGSIGLQWTLGNYGQIVKDDYFHTIFARTFGMAGLVTLVCVLIGLPEAYVLNRLSGHWRAVSIVIVLGPLLVSVVVRTLGWAILLGNEGVINKALLFTGLIDEPVRLMYTFTGVVIALVHVMVPFMVLSIWASLQKLDPATEQAADSLGAGLFTVLRRIVLAQALPGVLSGALIVFALTASAFATPAIIGGRRLKVMPTAIYDQFLVALDWPLGGALAATLVVAVLLVSVVANRVVERRFKQVFE
jgi:putative spermidine/putrescine transport system permease protein